MMKNPRNLMIFAVLGGVVGFVAGLTVSALSKPSGGITKGAETDIRVVLERQVEAWNTGNIESYMQDYMKGDDLRFASGGTIETGWQPTLERYLRRYPDRSAMGRLETEDLEIKVIDEDDAFVFGTWALIRESDRPSGLYTLHLKKIEDEWVIVSDHTSSSN